jgi:hypothetical protein
MANRVELTLSPWTWLQWSQRLWPIFIFVLTAGVIANLQTKRLSQLEAKADQDRTKAEYLLESQQIKTSLKLLQKLPNLGFNNLIADWSYLNFLQYFGDDKARPKVGYSVSPDFFELAVARDPKFLGMYPYLSASVTLYAAKPQISVKLLEQATKSIPPSMYSEAYFLWHSKATDELLFLGRTKDAQQSYIKAAEWVSQSKDPNLQAIAQRSRQTAQFLATNPNSRRARVGAWFSILSNAIDDASRKLAVQQIQALGGQISFTNGVFQAKMPQKD